MTADRRGAAADVLLAAAMVAVPLVSSSAFVDQYTTVKWYVLHAFAAVWLLVEVWVHRSARWPAFVREQRAAVAALLVLATWSACRAGAAQAVSPLADRVACGIVALCAAWAFHRRPTAVRALVAGLASAVTITIAVGFAQAGGWTLPAALTAREGPAAFFGNVNMAAQFVGLALVLVVAMPEDARGRRRTAWNALRIALALAGAVYLYVLASRSVLVALAAAVIALGWKSRHRFGAMIAAATLAALLVWHPWPRLDPALAGDKATSIALRRALWADTLDLVRARPLGVGAGNFEHAFLPFQARGRLAPQESVVFKSPHNEYLRYAAEDGLPFVVLAGVIGALLARRWRGAAARSPLLDVVVIGWGSFLVVEAAFQFPLALAFGALAASLTVGAALASVEGSAPLATRRAPWLVGGTLVSVALLAATARIAWSEALYVRGPDDLHQQQRACALDARNLPACVTAAWLEVRAGDVAAAVTRLDAVLAGAPGYPPALKLLGEIALLQGDQPEACRRLGEYDALFRGRSAVHESAEAACRR